MSNKTIDVGNGWVVESYSEEYIIVKKVGKPGDIQIKADVEGFVVDAFQTQNAFDDSTSIGTFGVTYEELMTYRGGTQKLGDFVIQKNHVLITDDLELGELTFYAPDFGDITGAMVLVGDTEYDEVWLTNSNQPNSIEANYTQVF